MRQSRAILFLLSIASFLFCGNAAAELMRPANVRCEYLVDPMGIDVARPRLSWQLTSAGRGKLQTAYRILVASSPELIGQQRGDLWDTGKVQSDNRNQVAYAGAELTSHQRCYWAVMVWNENDQASKWSAAAKWSMGLLQPSDWQAQWIGWDEVPEIVQPPVVKTPPIEQASWIWYPVSKSGLKAPGGACFFRQSFELPADRKVKSAIAQFSADNSAKVFLNTKNVLSVDGFRNYQTVDITETLVSGVNQVAVRAVNEAGAPNPAGLIGVVRITFESGPPLQLVTAPDWKATLAEPGEKWMTKEFSESADVWMASRLLGKMGMKPWGKTGQAKRSTRKKRYLPSPHLRKVFRVSGKIKQASLSVSAQGFAEMRVNGNRVGDEYFTPGWTDYQKRIYYRTYDVTDLLQDGNNSIGGILGDGWFRGNISILGQNRYGDKLRLLSQLRIEYTDGRIETIGTDPSWKTAFGPIRESDMQAGETYDARLEMPGWDRANFDDSDWAKVDVGSDTKALIQSYPGVPVRAIEEVSVVELTEPKRGQHVFDLGQNFSGWIRLKVQGKAGDKVVMRFAEMLNKDGTVFTRNLRSARCTDTYILKGAGVETWEPHFTFHGFRYVEITGLPQTPTPEMVTGIVVHSDAPMASEFTCSDPMLNQLHQNILWGQRSNYLEIPTDCPQRDERLGWTGDTQVFIRSGCYNQDVAAFFSKWIVDLVDSQNKSGFFGNQAPVFHGHGSPAWADAGIICPWTIYQVYGDTRLIEQHYDAMARFIAACEKTGLSGPGKGFGDWLSIGSMTPKDLISAAYFANSTRMMAEMAEAIGKTDDAQKYRELLGRIRKNFQQTFVDADGVIAGNSQTAYCLALYFDLLTPKQRAQAAEHLVDRIKAKDYHLSVGFVGVPILLPTLTQIGRSDLAYRLIQNKTYPSWGYSVEQGATTIWERWNSYTIADGIGQFKMNSFNHYAYGSCSEWMFRSMLGIETQSDAFQVIEMKPEIGGKVAWAKGHHDSIRGRIKSDWKRTDDEFRWTISVPAGSLATVYVPASAIENVTESGKSVSDVGGVEVLRMEDGRAVLSVGSGDYQFLSRSFSAK